MAADKPRPLLQNSLAAMCLTASLKTQQQKSFNIQHKFQQSTPCPNDMIHTLVMSKQSGSFFFQFVWPSQNICTLLARVASIKGVQEYELPASTLAPALIRRLQMST